MTLYDRIATIEALLGIQLQSSPDSFLTQLAAPSGLVVTQGGTTGSTNYSYVIADLGNAGTAAPCTAVQTTSGYATLSSTNFNNITFNTTPGHLYGIYRSASSGTPSTTGLIGTFLCPVGTTTTTIADMGQTATGNVPTGNSTGADSPAGPVFCNQPAMDGPLPVALSLTSGQTLTTAQMLGTLLDRTGPTTGFTDTTATAAALVAAVPGVKAGCCYQWMYRNRSTATSTLAAGTGVTLATGNTNTTATVNTHSWLICFTNVNPGSEAVTMYSLGSALTH